MSRQTLPFTVAAGVAVIDVQAETGPQDQLDLLRRTRDRILADPGIRRVEVNVCVDDRPRRRALHRAGFRLEGISRQAALSSEGPVDIARYALLRDQAVEGHEAFTAVMNTVTARKRVIAHVLITDPDQRVAVLETTFKPDFELPGGIVEPGESPRDGLRRELVEEVGTEVSVGRLLIVDWLAPYLGWEDAVELIFDGGVVAQPELLVPDGVEIRTIHWLPADQAARQLADYARQRLMLALQARRDGDGYYLEAGRPIG